MESKPQITYEDFAKLDIRTAKILEAEPLGEKLIKMKVKVGSEERSLVAGIQKWYNPEQLIGKTIVMLFNLKPRKLLGVESQGMILGVDSDVDEGGDYILLTPDKETEDGKVVR